MTKADLSGGAPRLIRHSNVVAALQALFDQGQLSRAALARHLGLNRSSSGHIIAELLASDLVREVPDTAPQTDTPVRAGRPGVRLELQPDAACFVGVEIGVEHITTLRMNLKGTYSHCRIEPFDGRSVPVAIAVEQAVAQAFDGMPQDLRDSVEGFGLAVPAQIEEAGLIHTAPLLGWENEDLRSLVDLALRSEFPVMIENDANAFAFGESYCDRANRAGVTLFMVLESGVGGGIVIDGKLYRGGHGLAGEIGHMHIRDGAELEEVLGRDHLLQRYRVANGGVPVSIRSFLDAVQRSDPQAVAIASDWAQDLAQAIVSACRLLDPNRVVLGGGLAALYPMVATQVLNRMGELQARTFPCPKIVVHKSAESGAAFGAACMLHQRFLSLENEMHLRGPK
ncbi:ROK family protein [Pseudotabrizicola sp.]|uniref:ROK family protein n=1 Tax=Pseudotabrizicola sp. TaxID=2939647 RepID=UPI00272455E2|nr:ROK family protein [Pseudotabrizicola sp.]MDO8882172.1 ROK family protein [Pseudotabrizicola sp.]